MTTQTAQHVPQRPLTVTIAAVMILVFQAGVVLTGLWGWLVVAFDWTRSGVVPGGLPGVFVGQLPWTVAAVLLAVRAVGVLRGRGGGRTGIWVLSGLLAALLVAHMVVVGSPVLVFDAIELTVTLAPSLLLAMPSASAYFRGLEVGTEHGQPPVG